MKNILLSPILFSLCLFAFTFQTVSASPVTFTNNTTLSLTSPSINLTVSSGSVADSVTVNSGNVFVTMSNTTGGTFTLTSPKALTITGGTATQSCSSGTETETITQSSGTATYTLTPTGSACGGVSTPTPTPTPTPVVVAPANGSPSIGGVNITLPTYIKPRAQIVYPDGHIVYLDTVTPPQTTSGQNNTTNTSNTPSNSPSITFIFNKDLKPNQISNEVKQLQIFLNTHGFVVVKKGAGSPGNETTKFGSLTQKAVKAFQIKYKIKPANGYLGPLTRSKIKELGK